MPTYRVRDPKSGRTFDLKGDAPPTAEQLQTIFGQMTGAPAPAPAPASTPRSVRVDLSRYADPSKLYGPAQGAFLNSAGNKPPATPETGPLYFNKDAVTPYGRGTLTHTPPVSAEQIAKEDAAFGPRTNIPLLGAVAANDVKTFATMPSLVENVKGFAKAVGRLPLSILDTLTALGRGGAAMQGATPIDSTEFEKSIGLDQVRALLEASNPDQVAGGVTESAAEMLLPGLNGQSALTPAWQRIRSLIESAPDAMRAEAGVSNLVKDGRVLVPGKAPAETLVPKDDLAEMLRQLQDEYRLAETPEGTPDLRPILAEPDTLTRKDRMIDAVTDFARRARYGMLTPEELAQAEARRPKPTVPRGPLPAEARTTGTGMTLQALPEGPQPPYTPPTLPGPPRRAPRLETARTGTGSPDALALPAEPMPYSARVSVTEAPRVEAPVPRPETTATGTGAPAQPMVPDQPLKWTITAPTRQEHAAAVNTAVEELKAAAPAAASPVEAFTQMMADKGAKIDAVVDKAATAAGPQAAADALQKQALSIIDIIKDMRKQHGAERVGDLLFGNTKREGVLGVQIPDRAVRKAAIRKIDPTPSRTPQVALDAQAAAQAEREAAGYEALKGGKKDNRESGFTQLQLALGLTGGGAGAAFGATQGDSAEDRVLNGLLYGTLGAVLAPTLAHAVAQGSSKPIQEFAYGSILSSPSSAFKAYLGAGGGSIAAALEKMAAGNVQAGARILHTLFSPGSVKTFVRALKNPATAHASGMAGGQAPTFIGKVFGAGDAVAKRAMAAGGISAEEASRYTLAGNPTSEVGKGILALWGRSFGLRLVTTMFPRVGVQVLERGAERLPIGAKLARTINPAAGSTRAILSKQAMGGAAAATAYGLNDQVPDWAKPYLVALSGVYALPVGAGMALAEGGPEGALSKFAENMPFPQYGPTESLKQLSTGAIFIPNLMRDVARAADPYERETSASAGGYFARAKAKLPGVRESLPVRGRAVNIAGVPNQDRSHPLSRFFTPGIAKSKPMQDVPPAVARELQRLEVSINVPNYKPEGFVGKTKLADLPINPDLLEQQRQDRRKYVIPQIERLLASPAYQKADDKDKKRRLTVVVERAQQAGAAQARARLIATLRKEGVLKK